MKIKHVTKHSLIYAITAWCLYNMTLYQLIAFIGGRLRLDYVIFADTLYYGIFGAMIAMYFIAGGIKSKLRVNYPLLTIMIEYTEVRNFAQGEEEWASHRDSATMDVA